MALEACAEPSLLEGTEPIYDKDGGGEVRREDIVAALRTYGDVLVYVSDWERGMFHLTLSEYMQLPNVLYCLHRLYRNFLTRKRNEQSRG